jgi:hypothetical protein
MTAGNWFKEYELRCNCGEGPKWAQSIQFRFKLVRERVEATLGSVQSNKTETVAR